MCEGVLEALLYGQCLVCGQSSHPMLTQLTAAQTANLHTAGQKPKALLQEVPLLTCYTKFD